MTVAADWLALMSRSLHASLPCCRAAVSNKAQLSQLGDYKSAMKDRYCLLGVDVSVPRTR